MPLLVTAKGSNVLDILFSDYYLWDSVVSVRFLVYLTRPIGLEDFGTKARLLSLQFRIRFCARGPAFSSLKD